MPNVRFKKDFFQKSGKNGDFLAILEQFLGFFHFFFTIWLDIPEFNLDFLFFSSNTYFQN